MTNGLNEVRVYNIGAPAFDHQIWRWGIDFVACKRLQTGVLPISITKTIHAGAYQPRLHPLMQELPIGILLRWSVRVDFIELR